jgi:hypothetical protein
VAVLVLVVMVVVVVAALALAIVVMVVVVIMVVVVVAVALVLWTAGKGSRRGRGGGCVQGVEDGVCAAMDTPQRCRVIWIRRPTRVTVWCGARAYCPKINRPAAHHKSALGHSPRAPATPLQTSPAPSPSCPAAAHRLPTRKSGSLTSSLSRLKACTPRTLSRSTAAKLHSMMSAPALMAWGCAAGGGRCARQCV